MLNGDATNNFPTSSNLDGNDWTPFLWQAFSSVNKLNNLTDNHTTLNKTSWWLNRSASSNQFGRSLYIIDQMGLGHNESGSLVGTSMYLRPTSIYASGVAPL
jgi:hypothetical protein